MARRYSNVIEQDAEEFLLQYIIRAKGLCFKIKFLGLMGAPDRLVLMPGGRFYFVELKKLGGALEPSQAVMFPRMLKRGFPVHVLTGIDQVKQFIEKEFPNAN
jgi:hypothetical protein